jgi:hypothetical protein
MSLKKDSLYEKIVSVDEEYRIKIQSDQFLLSEFEDDKEIVNELLNLVKEEEKDIIKLMDFLFENWHEGHVFYEYNQGYINQLFLLIEILSKEDPNSAIDYYLKLNGFIDTENSNYGCQKRIISNLKKSKIKNEKKVKLLFKISSDVRDECGFHLCKGELTLKVIKVIEELDLIDIAIPYLINILEFIQFISVAENDYYHDQWVLADDSIEAIVGQRFIEILGKNQIKESIPILNKIVRGSINILENKAIEALGKIGDKRGIQTLILMKWGFIEPYYRCQYMYVEIEGWEGEYDQSQLELIDSTFKHNGIIEEEYYFELVQRMFEDSLGSPFEDYGFAEPVIEKIKDSSIIPKIIDYLYEYILKKPVDFSLAIDFLVCIDEEKAKKAFFKIACRKVDDEINKYIKSEYSYLLDINN